MGGGVAVEARWYAWSWYQSKDRGTGKLVVACWLFCREGKLLSVQTERSAKRTRSNTVEAWETSDSLTAQLGAEFFGGMGPLVGGTAVLLLLLLLAAG